MQANSVKSKSSPIFAFFTIAFLVAMIVPVGFLLSGRADTAIVVAIVIAVIFALQLIVVAFLRLCGPAVPIGKPSEPNNVGAYQEGVAVVPVSGSAASEEVSRPTKRSRWDIPPEPSCCPVCKGEIERGGVSVQGSAASFLLVGMSYQHCWFKSPSGNERVVIASGQATPGFRCVRCGFVGIYNSEAE
jgi:hypothetical protein